MEVTSGAGSVAVTVEVLFFEGILVSVRGNWGVPLLQAAKNKIKQHNINFRYMYYPFVSNYSGCLS